MVTVNDQVKLSELGIQLDDLYSELIDMVELNNYDLDEIEAINHEIEELDKQVMMISTKYVPSLVKLL